MVNKNKKSSSNSLVFGLWPNLAYGRIQKQGDEVLPINVLVFDAWVLWLTAGPNLKGATIWGQIDWVGK